MRSTSLKFAILGICCAIPMAVAWLPAYDRAIQIACVGNYWFVLAIFVAFVAFAALELRMFTRHETGGWLRANLYGLLAALVLAAFLQANELHRPKVLYDEDTICGIAWMMHEQRSAAFPVKAHNYEGSQEIMAFTVDKRPVGFPFLLSVVHDLTGYRTANVYILNAALGFAFLALLFLWAKPVCGQGGAIAAMILVCTLPLLAQNATCAGFEVFNIFLVLGLALAARRYLGKPGVQGLDLMICVGLFLSVSRYESVLYLFAIVAVVIVKWLREKHVTLTWFSVLSPLLLVSALVTNRVFMGNKGSFEAHEGKPFFALSNFTDNLGHAVYYLFAPPWDSQTNSILLSAFGLLAVILLLVRFGARLRKSAPLAASTVALLAVGAIVVVNTLLGLFENWGQWDDPVAARFSLPFETLLTLCFVAALVQIWRSRRVPVLVPALAALWMLSVASVQMSSHAMTNHIPASHDAQFYRDWARKNVGERDLIVDESCIGLIMEGHACVPFVVANAAPWKLQAAKDAGFYDHVYVFERKLYDTKTGTWGPFNPGNALKAPLKLRLVAETYARLGCHSCIYEVTGVDDPELAKHPKPTQPDKLFEWKRDVLP